MNEIEKSFLEKGKAQKRNEIILLAKIDALDFIRECAQCSIEILGIDGFYLREDDRIQPSLENSIDFSTRSNVSDSDVYNRSLEFISKRGDKLVYEIVCS